MDLIEAIVQTSAPEQNQPEAAPPAPTTGTSSKFQIYAHGFDELVTSQALTQTGRRHLSSTLPRLLEAAQTVDPNACITRGYGRRKADVIACQHFNLTLHRNPADWQARCQASARSLHLHPGELWFDMKAMRGAIARAALPGIHAAGFNLHSWAHHADMGGYSLSDRNRRRLPQRPRHKVERTDSGAIGTIYMGRSRKLYDKVAELLVRPHKAYIKDMWATNGWREGDAVTRFEVQFTRGKRPEFYIPDFDADWVKAVRLSRPNPPGSKKRKMTGRIHPAWQPLLALSFTPPWDATDAPMVAPSMPLDLDRTFKQKIGSAIDTMGFFAASQGYATAKVREVVANSPLAGLTEYRADMTADVLRKVHFYRLKYGWTAPADEQSTRSAPSTATSHEPVRKSK